MLKKNNGPGKVNDIHVFNARLEEKFCTGKPFVLDHNGEVFGKDNLYKVD